MPGNKRGGGGGRNPNRRCTKLKWQEAGVTRVVTRETQLTLPAEMMMVGVVAVFVMKYNYSLIDFEK